MLFKTILFKQLITLLIILSCFTFSQSQANNLDDAKVSITKKDYKSAIIHLKNHLKQSPKEAQARYLLGDIYLRMGKLEASVKELGRAHQYKPGNHNYLFKYTNSLQRSGQYNKIIDIFKNDTYIKENDPKRLSSLAFANLGLNNIDAAKSLFKAANKDSDNVMALNGLASIALRENELTQAGDYLTRSLTVSPNNSASLKLNAKLSNLNKQPKQALKLYDELIEKNKNDLGLYLDRAMTKLFLEKTDEAKSDIQQVLSKVAVHPQANLMMAQLYLQEKNFNEAKVSAQKVINVVPNNAQALLILGTAHLGLKSYLQADKHLTSYLSQAPNDLRAQSLLANVYLAQKKPRQALLILQEVDNEKNQNSLPLLLTLADTYFALGDFSNGIVSLKKAQIIAPDNEQIKKRLIGAQLQTGEVDQAVNELEALSASGQAKGNDNYLLISSYIKQNKLDKAKNKIHLLSKQTPKDLTLKNLDALVSQLAGKFKQAQKKYEEIISLDKKNIPAHMGLSRLYVSQKEWQKASNAFQQVVKIDPQSIKAYLGLAGVAQKQQKTDQIENYFMQALKASQSKVETQLAVANLLSRWYGTQKQAPKILELASQLTSDHPNNTKVQGFLIKAQLVNKQTQQAIQSLENLISKEANNIQHRVLLAKLLAVTPEKINQAISLIDDALAVVPSNEDKTTQSLYITKVSFLLRDKKYNQALDIAKILSTRFAKESIGKIIQADIYRAQGKYAKALPLYQQVYDDKPESNLLNSLVDTLIKLKQTKKAINLLTQTTQSSSKKDSPENISNLFKLASLYHQGKAIKKAQTAYENLLNIDPTHVATLNNLAWIVIDTNVKKAVSMAQRAHEQQPKSAAIKDTYGYFLAKSGKAPEGLVLVKEAAEQIPTDLDIQFHLAYALNKVGNKNEAKAILKKLRDHKEDFSEKTNAQSLLKKI